VFGVAAASRNTRFQAARCDLAPADRASFGWRFLSFDHLGGPPLEEFSMQNQRS